MATVSTNVGKPKKKKNTAAPAAGGVRPFKVEPQGKTELTFERGKTTKTYTPKREFTGHKAYGKDNPSKPDPKFVEEARAKKKDIAYDKEGKPYRAGETTESKTPDKVSIVTPKLKISKVTTNVKPHKSTEEIRQQNAPGPKKKMERVFYLRNKDSKGGISKEGRRPKKEAGY